MRSEEFDWKVTRYWDDAENPTCIAAVEGRKVCHFFATQRFGTNETCLLAEIDYHGIGTPLARRRGRDGQAETGTLIPGDWCPLWETARAMNAAWRLEGEKR